jgi:uncharacterized protein YacL
MDDFDAIQTEIQRLAEQESNLQEAAGAATEALERLRQARDRSFIVKCVVVLYGVVIGLTVLYLITRGLLWKEDTFDNVSEIVKVAVVPIVTLVIGYYFSKTA